MRPLAERGSEGGGEVRDWGDIVYEYIWRERERVGIVAIVGEGRCYLFHESGDRGV